MERRLSAFPWFLGAPAVVVVTALVAGFGYVFVGDLFVQTCANEVNLLTGEVEAACGEGDESPGTPENVDGSGSVVLTGSFEDGEPGHRGAGMAEVQRLADGSLNLHLSEFSVTSGPDLFVYLSKSADGDPGEFLNLGKLTANNGSQNYAIPAGTSIEEYRRVLVWCRQFAVNFAFAPLAEPGMELLNAPATVTGQAPSAAATSASPANPTAVPGGTNAPAATVTPAAATSPTRAPATAPGVLARGSFVDGAPGHFGSGSAEVQRLADGSLNLRLGNFSVTNGPDLIVYLSPSADDYVGGGVSLGSLKANNGNQNYTIPAGTNLDGVRSVIIWCKSFPTVFAYATLEVN